MPKDSPTYAYFKGLQDAGANLTAEKALLSTQQDGNGAMLFQYTGVDRYFVDPWTQNKTGTRLAGAGQAGVGVLGAMGSVALCTTGIGCAAGAISGTISVDYALAGAKQSITGNAQTPYGEQALQSLGLSPQAAAYTYAALGLTPVAVDAMFMKAASGVSSGVVGSEVRTAGGVGAGDAVLDGGSGVLKTPPQSIEYTPSGSVVLQPKGSPLCGPATCNMVINDANGNVVDLNQVVGQFQGIRTSGVNINEMNQVLSKNGIVGSKTTTLSIDQLNAALANGQSVIVGVPAGTGNHFIIVDSIKTVNNIPYYMTRDPFVGPRGVRGDILTNAINENGNAIIVGK